MYVRNRASGLTTLVVAMGWESDADKLRLNQALASLGARTQEPYIGQGPISLRVFSDALGNDKPEYQR